MTRRTKSLPVVSTILESSYMAQNGYCTCLKAARYCRFGRFSDSSTTFVTVKMNWRCYFFQHFCTCSSFKLKLLNSWQFRHITLWHQTVHFYTMSWIFCCCCFYWSSSALEDFYNDVVERKLCAYKFALLRFFVVLECHGFIHCKIIYLFCQNRMFGRDRNWKMFYADVTDGIFSSISMKALHVKNLSRMLKFRNLKAHIYSTVSYMKGIHSCAES